MEAGSFGSSSSVTQSISPQNQRQQNDVCFKCKMKGHWAKDCPSKSPKFSQPFNPVFSNGSEIPLVDCHCGGGVCSVITSRTAKNPNRKFYSCPGRLGGKDCGFFKWCNELNSSQFEVPLCSCGAGACSVHTETKGPNSGKTYFTCRLKKVCPETRVSRKLGFGACKFFQWEGDSHLNVVVNEHSDEDRLDIHPHSTGNILKVNNTVSSDLGERGNQIVEHLTRMKLEPPVADKLKNSPKVLVVPAPLNTERVRMAESGDGDETSNTSTLRDLDNSLPVLTTEKDSFDTRDIDIPEAKTYPLMMQKAIRAYHPISTDGIRRQSPKFWIQISSVTDNPSRDLIHHVLGWSGRLAFPPARGLAIPLRIFPSFNPIRITEEKIAFDATDSTNQSQSPNAENILTPKDYGQIARLSDRAPMSIAHTNIITGTIQEAFRHAASCVQNKLLALLESMDPLDHESMDREAESTFAALDRLFIDYTSFRSHVKNFIQCASSLASLAQSICNYPSSQEELIEQYNSKKATFDKIFHIHASTLKDFRASSERLLLLREEASRIKNMLIQTENKLACCEAETSWLETRVDEIWKQKLEAERSLQNAEEAFEVCQEREANWCVVKEEFDKAKNSLHDVI